MPVVIQTQVGPVVAGDTNQPIARSGREGEVVVTELHGKYFEQARVGRLYVATTAAAGAAVPIFSNVIQQFLIWNPPGSLVMGVLDKVIFGYVSAAFVPGYFCLAHSLTTQAQPGTTTLAPTFGARVGSLSTGKIQVYTPGTVATALTIYRPLNISVDTAVGASTNAPWKFSEDFDGDVLIPPGGLLAVAANAAQTAVCAIAALWEEVPYVA